MLHALEGPTTPQQHSAICADVLWQQVRSSAPMQSWVRALRQEGVAPPTVTTNNRRQAAVDMLRALVSHLQDRHQLRRLAVCWPRR